jgi:hypothetical protein
VQREKRRLFHLTE